MPYLLQDISVLFGGPQSIGKAHQPLSRKRHDRMIVPRATGCTATGKRRDRLGD
jgi:hypothetical protein